MYKYDDIKITKNNSTYNIVCISNPDAKPIKFTFNSKSIKSTGIELNENDVSTMYDYIYDNCLDEYINWIDPFDGNKIFHELVLTNNVKQIERLIQENVFDYTCTNNHNLTPIDFIKSTQLAKIITLGLIKNFNSTKEKLIQEKENVNIIVNNLKHKINKYESSEYKEKIINETEFFEIIFIKTKEYHFIIKIILFLLLVVWISDFYF
jgi:hypothetical protein